LASRNTAVVIGASAGVGRAVAEQLAARQYDLVLASTDNRDIKAICSNLVLQWNIKCHAQVLDLSDASVNLHTFHNSCISHLGRIKAVFITAGFISPEDDKIAPDDIIQSIASVNYLNAIRLVGLFAQTFE